MKATITKVPFKTPSIKYADLKVGTLYNYSVRGDHAIKGIIFIAAEVDGTPCIIELDGQDAGMIWSKWTGLKTEEAYGNIIFTSFNDSINLRNE